MSKRDCKLILALDLPDRESALKILDGLRGKLEWVKIGLQMYLKYGADFVREVSGMGFKIFLDLKLFDIPNTVASAVESVSALPVSMLTIHASGGREMMRRAVESAAERNPELLILGVTVITSFDADSLAETGVELEPEWQVEKLAKLAVDSGLKGLVCSPLEIEGLRSILPEDTVLVTPGIRPSGSSADEQKRIMTPADAARAGSDFIVVGRPILKAENPAFAVSKILEEIANA
ncbi:MAG TPA: orotidine-5'-phosphate decarboxylase [Candidatus Merdousia gallistercoris]|nr:orotidine-5'-phosphate decarboxylase [Candidatus Merdousia gallistercoris]